MRNYNIFQRQDDIVAIPEEDINDESLMLVQRRGFIAN